MIDHRPPARFPGHLNTTPITSIVSIDHVDCAIPLLVDVRTGERVMAYQLVRDAPSPRPAAAFSTPSYSAASSTTRLVMSVGGEYSRIRRVQTGPPESRDWRRGEVVEFSARSRSRMLQSIARIDQRTTVLDGWFITLTYPDAWPCDSREYKADLDAWRKRVLRCYPKAWWYWRLEYQQRAAPHFHLLVFGMDNPSTNWLRGIWYKIVAGGDPAHWRYGTKIDQLHSWKEAARYAAKYASKIDEGPTPLRPGRFWGIANRRERHETILDAPISETEFYVLRRLMRRLINVRSGYHAPGGPHSGVWARCQNETIKRALEFASNARTCPSLVEGIMSAARPAADDTPETDTGQNNIVGYVAAPQTTTDRKTGKTSEALFDSADLARRWARRWI